MRVLKDSSWRELMKLILREHVWTELLMTVLQSSWRELLKEVLPPFPQSSYQLQLSAWIVFIYFLHVPWFVFTWTDILLAFCFGLWGLSPTFYQTLMRASFAVGKAGWIMLSRTTFAKVPSELSCVERSWVTLAKPKGAKQGETKMCNAKMRKS